MYFKSPIVNKMAEMFIHEKTDVRESSFANTTCLPTVMMDWITSEALLSAEVAIVRHTLHKDKDWYPICDFKIHKKKKNNNFGPSAIKSEMKGIPQAYA